MQFIQPTQIRLLGSIPPAHAQQTVPTGAREAPCVTMARTPSAHADTYNSNNRSPVALAPQRILILNPSLPENDDKSQGHVGYFIALKSNNPYYEKNIDNALNKISAEDIQVLCARLNETLNQDKNSVAEVLILKVLEKCTVRSDASIELAISFVKHSKKHNLSFDKINQFSPTKLEKHVRSLLILARHIPKKIVPKFISLILYSDHEDCVKQISLATYDIQEEINFCFISNIIHYVKRDFIKYFYYLIRVHEVQMYEYNINNGILSPLILEILKNYPQYAMRIAIIATQFCDIYFKNELYFIPIVNLIVEIGMTFNHSKDILQYLIDNSNHNSRSDDNVIGVKLLCEFINNHFTRNSKIFSLSDFLDSTSLFPNQSQHGTLFFHLVILQNIYRFKDELNASLLERVSQLEIPLILKDIFFSHTSQMLNLKDETRSQAINLMSDDLRKHQDDIKKILSAPRAQVVIDYNFDDGYGDLIIRVMPLIQSLIFFNPQIQISLLTTRPHLFNNQAPNLILHDKTDPATQELNIKSDLLITYNASNNAVGSKMSTELFLSIGNTGSHYYCPSQFISKNNRHSNEKAKEYFDILWNPDSFQASVYSYLFNTLAFLGLPTDVTQLNQVSTILYEEKSINFFPLWHSIQNHNTQNRPIALINPFGGQGLAKGFQSYAPNVPYCFSTLSLYNIIQRLIENGYFPLILPSFNTNTVSHVNQWGSTQNLKTLLKDLSGEFYICDDNLDPALLNNILKQSDIVVTVEGGMMHASNIYDKNCYVLTMPNSGSSRWYSPYHTKTIMLQELHMLIE